MRLEPGTKVGTYEVTGVLGIGGMGEVYRARDTRLKRDVAIKALPEEFSRNPESIARFQREAELLATLNHSNIASIYDLQEAGGSRFLILEMVEGETLAERVARGPIPPVEALHIAGQICDAIDAAHEKNVIHRDLKPANIKLTGDGNVKLLDFGLARILGTPSTAVDPVTSCSLTTAGHVFLGTAAYMSPEQVRGKTVDQRADIWAFGCVLFEMLSGRQAFGDGTLPDMFAAILNQDPDWSLLPASIPRRIVDLIETCLEKDPDLRLRHISDARYYIKATKNETGRHVRGKRSAKRRAGLLASVLLICLLSFGAGIGLENIRNVETPAWHGSLLVGGSTVAWGPRVSPDGRRVAFIALVDRQTQVALMDAESGTWDVLTKRLEPGVRIHAAWSRDGSKVYFTRGTTEGVNIYSIPAVGGEERLVLDNAYFPEPLPDGSMLVTRSNAAGHSQLHRFWPESNRVEPLPAFLTSALEPLVPLRPFADGKEVVFYGRTMTSNGLEATPKLRVIDLLTKQVRNIEPDVRANSALWPVATDRGNVILSDSLAGDLHRLVAIDREGKGVPRTLVTLTGRFSGLDVAQDGSIFIDQHNNTLEVLRIAPSTGSVQRVARAETYLLKSHTIELSDGRVIVPSLISGRPRLMVTKANQISTPLIDTPEETSGPLSLAGQDMIAFLIGKRAVKSNRDGVAVRSPHVAKDFGAGCGFHRPTGGIDGWRHTLLHQREHLVAGVLERWRAI